MLKVKSLLKKVRRKLSLGADTRSAAEKQVHNALDELCRERDAEIFTMRRQTLAHQGDASQLQTINNSLLTENGKLRQQLKQSESEMFRIMVIFFVIGSVAASAAWYFAFFIF